MKKKVFRIEMNFSDDKFFSEKCGSKRRAINLKLKIFIVTYINRSIWIESGNKLMIKIEIRFYVLLRNSILSSEEIYFYRLEVFISCNFKSYLIW